MRIMDVSDDKTHFFVRVTDDGRLLYCRRKKAKGRSRHARTARYETAEAVMKAR
jgi:hypothetical protein